MKRTWLCLTPLCLGILSAHAADLLEVSQQALSSDPIYQQAISQRLSTKEGVPINVAALLPNIGLVVTPSVTRQANSGSDVDNTAFSPQNNTLRAYTLSLTATQTIFDAAQFAAVGGALAQSKGADATLNAALQDLMIRVSSAYFAVLRAEDNLNNTEASKIAYAEQLDQVKQQFDVGLKTITDVYTAKASYESAVAIYIQAQTDLFNNRENLRVLTGQYYPKLSVLSEDFPLITPKPHDIEQWVKTSQLQNWSIKASQFALDNAAQVFKQQFAGHLPSVNMQAELGRSYNNNINGYLNTSGERNGPSATNSKGITLNITMPLFAGGGVVAQTNQAAYNYRIAQQQLEQTVRSTMNTTRQSYLGITSGISQIQADRQAIISAQSSLAGMEASYRVGTETLVNVLNQQQKVLLAQTNYAIDRYQFVNNILALKRAAGTLSFDDLRAINAWLLADSKMTSKKPKHYETTEAHNKHEASIKKLIG